MLGGDRPGILAQVGRGRCCLLRVGEVLLRLLELLAGLGERALTLGELLLKLDDLLLGAVLALVDRPLEFGWPELIRERRSLFSSMSRDSSTSTMSRKASTSSSS
jgi:hypothetical protein